MEDFGYQRDGENGGNFSILAKRIFLVVATLLSLAVFAYITVNAYYSVYHDENSDVETIKSPAAPIKIAEEERGGEINAMKVDRSIYEDIFGNKKESIKAENTKIRSAPEPALPRKIIKDSPPAAQESNAAAKAGSAKEEKIIVYSDAKKQQQPKDLLTKMEGEKRDNTAAPAPKSPARKRYIRVQVAAMISKEAAEESWNRLNRLYPNLFSGLKSFIERVDLGKRGIFFRLQIGDFYNQVDAEEFCERYVAQAKKSRVDCIVVE